MIKLYSDTSWSYSFSQSLNSSMIQLTISIESSFFDALFFHQHSQSFTSLLRSLCLGRSCNTLISDMTENFSIKSQNLCFDKHIWLVYNNSVFRIVCFDLGIDSLFSSKKSSCSFFDALSDFQHCITNKIINILRRDRQGRWDRI